MDEKELAKILADKFNVSPQNFGIQRCWNMILVAKLAGSFNQDERRIIQEELMEIERRTHAGFGMVRFL